MTAPDLATRLPLFAQGRFNLHSGDTSAWKIDCDALTDDDLTTIALMLAELLPPFSAIEAVPRGGLRLAKALEPHICRAGGRILIVDDVLTTGASMEQQRGGRPCLGAVIFARGPVPEWVTPLFQHSAALIRYQAERETLRAQIEAAIPTSWLDPLLTGPAAVVGKPPYGCDDVERVLDALKVRLVALLAKGETL